MAPLFEKAIAADAVPDLIMMWQALMQGWEPPDQVSFQEFERLRHTDITPSALRAFVGQVSRHPGGARTQVVHRRRAAPTGRAWRSGRLAQRRRSGGHGTRLPGLLLQPVRHLASFIFMTQVQSLLL